MKMPKRLFFLLLLMAGIHTACDDWFDITPDDTGSPTAPTNRAELEETLLGVYAGLAENGNYGDSFWLLGELSVGWLTGETFWDFPSSPIDAIAFSRMQAGNTEVRRIWTRSYQNINAANLVLAYANLAGAEQAGYQAEARALRALLYFELVEAFSAPDATLGVPLVLQSGQTELPLRQSRTEVYAQIRADLEFARQHLPTHSTPFRFSKAAATALLARVALQEQDWETARELSNELIEEGRFSLGESLTAFSQRNAPGLLFALDRQSSTSGNLSTHYAEHIAVLRPHIARYPAGDRRADFFRPEGSTWRCRKWEGATDFVPVLRLAEQYLIRAEANQRLGAAVGAAPRLDLNALRFRADLPPLGGSITTEDLWEERRRELAYEGHYLRDIRRWALNPGNLPYNAPVLVLPIPQSELDANPNLVQNEGY